MSPHHRPSSIFALWLVATAANVGVQAQMSTFQWKFAQNAVASSLVQCQSYPLIAESRNVSNASAYGVPPYFITAFVPGGIPTNSYVGNDPNNLTWTVNQPVGTTMLLSMSDSIGNAGGIPAYTFEVVAGPSTAGSCLATQPTENITVASNITTNLRSCQQWGMRVFGGQKPYTISLAAVGSPVVTNVTLGLTDDVFTYIDRADPNGRIMAAVSDVTGQWGTSTPLIPTVGSVDVSCVGLVSTSGNSSFVDQHPKPPKANHTGAIVGGVIGGIAALLIIAGLIFYIRKRREEQTAHETQPAFLPEAWSPPVVVSGGGYPATVSEPDSSRSSKAAMAQAEWARHSGVLRSGGFSSAPSTSSAHDHGSVYGRPGSYAEPGSMSPSVKPLLGDIGESTPTSLSSRGGGAGPSVIPAGWSVEPDVIIQHQDGGVRVQELPPPYLTRGTGASGSAGPGPGPVAPAVEKR